MSGKHVAKDQPATFEFDANNQKRIQEILKKYPAERKKSAVMPLLDLAQRQH
ncbi:MAG: NADH-quinone oxidoreductase subunit E, partial [Candidatus Fonsibacter ubiquis]